MDRDTIFRDYIAAADYLQTASPAERSHAYAVMCHVMGREHGADMRERTAVELMAALRGNQERIARETATHLLPVLRFFVTHMRRNGGGGGGDDDILQNYEVAWACALAERYRDKRYFTLDLWREPNLTGRFSVARRMDNVAAHVLVRTLPALAPHVNALCCCPLCVDVLVRNAGRAGNMRAIALLRLALPAAKSRAGRRLRERALQPVAPGDALPLVNSSLLGVYASLYASTALVCLPFLNARAAHVRRHQRQTPPLVITDRTCEAGDAVAFLRVEWALVQLLRLTMDAHPTLALGARHDDMRAFVLNYESERWVANVYRLDEGAFAAMRIARIDVMSKGLALVNPVSSADADADADADNGEAAVVLASRRERTTMVTPPHWFAAEHAHLGVRCSMHFEVAPLPRCSSGAAAPVAPHANDVATPHLEAEKPAPPRAATKKRVPPPQPPPVDRRPVSRTKAVAAPPLAVVIAAPPTLLHVLERPRDDAARDGSDACAYADCAFHVPRGARDGICYVVYCSAGCQARVCKACYRKRLKGLLAAAVEPCPVVGCRETVVFIDAARNMPPRNDAVGAASNEGVLEPIKTVWRCMNGDADVVQPSNNSAASASEAVARDTTSLHALESEVVAAAAAVDEDAQTAAACVAVDYAAVHAVCRELWSAADQTLTLLTTRSPPSLKTPGPTVPMLSPLIGSSVQRERGSAKVLEQRVRERAAFEDIDAELALALENRRANNTVWGFRPDEWSLLWAGVR